jgi:hypothetical protein
MLGDYVDLAWFWVPGLLWGVTTMTVTHGLEITLDNRDSSHSFHFKLSLF